VTDPFDANWLFASVLLATPLVFAAIGELISQRAGVMNIGLEGMMLTGAFFAYLTAEKTGALVPGIVAGIAVGALMASLMALLAVRLRADQIITGVGLNILAFGLTAYLLSEFYPAGETPEIDGPERLTIPLLSDLPVVGQALFDQSPLVYLAYLMPPLAWLLLFRTRFGLSLRAAGELPAAAETAGVSAVRLRVIGTLAAGALAGLGGAFLSIGELGLFREQMTAGRGFLAFAAVIFGAWRPAGVLAACWIFGAAEALQLRLQAEVTVPQGVWLAAGVLAIAYLLWVARAGTPEMRRAGNVAVAGLALAGAVALFVVEPAWAFPSQVWLALPYVLTLLALAGFVGSVRAPRALGLPYNRVDA
jgi:general nucleoside transport system permease protein